MEITDHYFFCLDITAKDTKLNKMLKNSRYVLIALQNKRKATETLIRKLLLCTCLREKARNIYNIKIERERNS